ncbi:MAG TPA: hypothetical protein VNS63_15565 [Blastocatellia bacterium]|nr:hypothetical protein [Blastocatellia bacterium]
MKIKYAVGILVALLLVTTLGATLVLRGVASAEAFEASSLPEAALSLQSPFPDITIPGVPDKGDCCIWEIERRVDGKREAKFGNPYVCDMGQTRRGEMTIKMKLKFPGGPCDQQDIPADNSTLEARGVVIRQNDQYAYFSGEFSTRIPAARSCSRARSRLRIG